MNATARVAEAHAPPARLDALAELTSAMEGEGRLLRNLADVLRHQRDGVARDDVEGVERSVYDAQRLLLTLGESRKRRRTLMALATGAPDTSLDELEGSLGPRLRPDLAEALDGLRRDARGLAGELAINRRVLESAVSAGDRMLQALSGGGSAQAGLYGSAAGSERSGGGMLIDRRI